MWFAQRHLHREGLVVIQLCDPHHAEQKENWKIPVMHDLCLLTPSDGGLSALSTSCSLLRSTEAGEPQKV